MSTVVSRLHRLHSGHFKASSRSSSSHPNGPVKMKCGDCVGRSITDLATPGGYRRAPPSSTSCSSCVRDAETDASKMRRIRAVALNTGRTQDGRGSGETRSSDDCQVVFADYPYPLPSSPGYCDKIQTLSSESASGDTRRPRHLSNMTGDTIIIGVPEHRFIILL